MTTALIAWMNVALAIAGGAQEASAWTSKDIGKITVPGTTRYNQQKGIWMVRGEGSDIWGPADSFRYVCRPFKGDGSIIARVESISRTYSWTKVGVMIRENLDPESRFAAVYSTPGEGVRFHARVNTSDAVQSDTAVATEQQKAVTPPVWIKLERKGNRFYGYYATDDTGTNWKPLDWKPDPILMSTTAYVGLSLCSLEGGVLCDARFSGVSVDNLEGVLSGVDIGANPSLALERAYANLQRLGNWRHDAETKKRHGDLIANSLFTIAKVKELRGQPARTVVADYRRIAELLPDASLNALIRIAMLDGERGLAYVRKHLAGKPREEQEMFYATLIKGCGDVLGRREQEAVIKAFVEYLGRTANTALLDQAIVALDTNDNALSICMSLIRHSMAMPSNKQVAVTGLRYMALRLGKEGGNDLVPEVASWAMTRFKGTDLGKCARAVMADWRYDHGQYVEAIDLFHPGLLRKGSPGSEITAHMETAVAAYRGSTLRHTMMNLEAIYDALGREAHRQGLHAASLHCYRKVAATKGVSLRDFERSSVKGVKRCASGPENEVWFWKGLVAADAGDLSTATVAYERFLQEDKRSVLAARAYYDIARTRMAIGEDAREWIAKAKALSPCDVVIQLERQINTGVSQG